MFPCKGREDRENKRQQSRSACAQPDLRCHREAALLVCGTGVSVTGPQPCSDLQSAKKQPEENALDVT
eukprot:75926-Rhodomonas_salina.3